MVTEENEAPTGGENGGVFPWTHWSVVLSAQKGSVQALETLCRDYRSPLLVLLRSRGCPPQDAEDTVQGFFETLLHRDFLKQVESKRGRFRTFLSAAFKHYLTDQYHRQNAAKRGGGAEVKSLDETDEDGWLLHEPVAGDPLPEFVIDRAWADTVLANALRRLGDDCSRQGRRDLYDALLPRLQDEESASPYAETAKTLSMTEGSVKVAAQRLRARLRGLVRDEVAQTITNQADLDEEIGYMISLFGR